MIGQVRFKRAGDEIRVFGIDMGPDVRVIAENGKRAIWRAAGHNVWGGNYQPWRWYGAVYMAVETKSPESATIVREEQPGRQWRAALVTLQEWLVGS